MQNDMIKLNTLLHKEKGTQVMLQQENILKENDFISNLKVSFSSTIKTLSNSLSASMVCWKTLPRVWILKNFANSLDLDQAQQNVGPDLDTNFFFCKLFQGGQSCGLPDLVHRLYKPVIGHHR